jgi:hypothetical protein
MTRPVLAQRRFTRRNSKLDKPLVTTQVLDWLPGFHDCNNSGSSSSIAGNRNEGICDLSQSKPDSDLFLVHLKRFDYKYFMDRGLWKAKQNFHEEDLIYNLLGIHHHFVGQELIDLYYIPATTFYGDNTTEDEVNGESISIRDMYDLQFPAPLF